MKIDRQDNELLGARIDITLQPEDYSDKFNAELNKQAKNLKMKGFRKGKVPKKTLLKMFGKSVMAEVVFNQVNESLSNYLTSEKLDILGSPIAAEDQETIDFDPFVPGEFTFSFDVGLEPQFELKGIEDGTTYDYYDTQISDEMITEEWESRRKRMGKQEEVQDQIQENDRVYLQSSELEDGKIKEGGWQTEVVVLVNMLADEDLKKDLLTKKEGDDVTFQPSLLEKDTKEDYVRKHILQIEDEDLEVGDQFQGTIDKVVRVLPAELDENFFQSFGADVEDEEGAKERIKTDLEGFYKRQGEAIMYRQAQDKLLELNDIPMPVPFLERWIKTQDEKAAEKENFPEEVSRFVKSLQWTLIKRKLAKMGELSVTHGEVLDHFVAQIRQYMGGYGADDAFLMQTAQQLMENEEQVSQARERIIDDKIFEFMSGKVEKKNIEIDNERLNEIIKDLNAQS